MAESRDRERERKIFDRLNDSFSGIRFLGSGCFGEVYRGKVRGSTEYRALKIVPRSESSDSEYLALCRLPNHPYIITYYGNISLGQDICLVLEYCSGGNLNDFLLSHDREPSRDFRFMREIATGVAFLHLNGIVHRDLKPDNILLTANETIKIADFGLVKIASTVQHGGSLYNYYMESGLGHLFFMAPEVIDGRSTEKSDVFEMGAIFASILERKTVRNRDEQLVVPYVGYARGSPVGLGRALHDGLLSRYQLDENLQISRKMRSLVEQMLQKHFHARPIAANVVDAVVDDQAHGVGVDEYQQDQEPRAADVFDVVDDQAHGVHVYEYQQEQEPIRGNVVDDQAHGVHVKEYQQQQGGGVGVGTVILGGIAVAVVALVALILFKK